MSRLLLALLTSVLSASITGCTTTIHRDTDATTKEARAAAATYWETTLTRCGQYSYSDDYGITAYKDFDYTLRDIPIAKTDRDHGIEWRMRTAVRPATPYRLWDPVRKDWEGGWSNVGIAGWSIEIEKRKGKIFYRGVTETDETSYQPKRLDCSVLPK
jgi:hypothetical protein